MPVKFKVIAPRLPDIKAMRKPYIEAMEQTILIAQDMFEETVRTWEDEPKFKKKVKDSANEIIGTVDTDDEIYKFVTRGTRVRYATMSTDFQPKTERRVIGSSPGRGEVLYVDTRRPRPGIEAREFEEEIAKETEPILKTKAEQASVVAANKSGHSI